MSGRRLGTLAGLLFGIGVSCAISGFTALIFGATVGGVGTAVAPDFHFNLVSDYVCPEGTTLEYRQAKYSYNEPGEYTLEASCEGEGMQEIRGQELKAIGAVIGLYIITCFIPLFIIGIIFSGTLMGFISKITKRSSPPSVIE
jgi:hypothetical protein